MPDARDDSTTTVGELVWRLRADGANTVDIERMQELLRGSLDARREYIRYMRLVSDLRVAESPEQMARPGSAGRHARQQVSGVLGFLSALGGAIQLSPRALVTILGSALASYFLIMLALIPLSRQMESARLAGQTATPDTQPSAAPGTKVGMLAKDETLKWKKDRWAAPRDRTLRVGERYELASGQAQVVLARGVRLAIDGPAVWQLASDQRLVLDSGRLAAHVSPKAVGFAVVTPCVDVIDLGTEFAVAVESDGRTEVYVERGTVELKQPSHVRAAEGPEIRGVRLTAGKAARVTARELVAGLPSDGARFSQALQAVARLDRSAGNEQTSTIWLSNLFDDDARTPLAEAMRTDTFRAMATTRNLGVNWIAYGGPFVKEIASGLTFDLTNLGWDSGSVCQITNDAHHGDDDLGRGGGLRIAGVQSDVHGDRLEDGIGQTANSLITFDLGDLRRAGGLEGRGFVFRSERAGIFDGLANCDASSVHMVALVSGKAGVRAAWVDGQPATLVCHDRVWSIDSPIGQPLGAHGQYASFRLPIAPDDDYLTLIVSAAGNGLEGDNAAWIDARLEVRP